jgi:hypothetical protein
VLATSVKETLGIDEFTPENLHAIALSGPPLSTLLAFLNEVPEPIV